MSNFFDKSDLTEKDADKIVSDTLQNCDDGELYLEDTKSESILLDDNKIKSSSYSSDLGFGFRAITGEVVAYSHSNEISAHHCLRFFLGLSAALVDFRFQHRFVFGLRLGLFDFFRTRIRLPSMAPLRISESI